MPSPSLSAWSAFAVVRQLSSHRIVSPALHGWCPTVPSPSPSSRIPSLSSSGSQASPIRSPSVSSWFALAVNWQLSSQLVVDPPVHLSLPIVPSASASGIPSLSSSESQASPNPSPSLFFWSGLAFEEQLSQTSPTPSPSPSAWFALATDTQLSQMSPTPSPSVSALFDEAFFGHLSVVSGIPSLSSSVSQASPVPSPSVSVLSEALLKLGHLSQASPHRSPSASAWFAFATNWQLSSQLVVCPPVHLLVPTVPSSLPSSRIPSLSSSPSQASPVPSRSLSSWFTFALFTQLSQASPTPSESASAWLVLDLNWQLSSQLVVAPPVQG